MRGQIFELHPYVLDHAGLAAALRAIADRFAARMDAEITIAVDPAAAGHHDELIVVLGREFLANAAKHSRAEALKARAHRPRIERAASPRRRPRASRGTAAGHGTSVRATLPSAGVTAAARRLDAPSSEHTTAETRSSGPAGARWSLTRIRETTTP